MFSPPNAVPRNARCNRLLAVAVVGGAAWAVVVGGGVQFVQMGVALGCVCVGLLTSWTASHVPRL